MTVRGRAILSVLAAVAAVTLTGAGAAAPASTSTEVVVTLKGSPLSAFGRSLQSASHHTYVHQVAAAQAALTRRIEQRIPGSRIRWHYRLVANGLAVVLPETAVGDLARVPGVAEVWPNTRYHALRTTSGVEQIGAPQIWGSNLETAGAGMKIGIIDDGLDATHPYFSAAGFQYPPGFPKGQKRLATPKVIVQRAFAPPSPKWKYAGMPFDPTGSFHAMHVAGIAAGDHDTRDQSQLLTGVAPLAYLGNYKVLTIPTPDFGLDGNAAEIVAGIEAAVGDGMNVINLSLGEPEVESSRDLVAKAIDGAAAAGVVPVVAAGNDFDRWGPGSVDSPGSADAAITVAAVTAQDTIASFSSGGPTPISLRLKPDVAAPGVSVLSAAPKSQGTWQTLSGTSMATPHVAAGAALLLERHPDWTVAQVKSALVLTGDPVRGGGGAEALATREGGGLINLVQADNPLVFAAPSNISFGLLGPRSSDSQTVTVTDAGGGAGVWSVSVEVQQGPGTVAAPATVTVPGPLNLTATAAATAGDVAGFVVLSNGTVTRRIPFWFGVSAPRLGTERFASLHHAGVYHATTAGGASRVSSYRYPSGGDVSYPGPERVYRVHVGAAANFGVVVTSGRAVPHITVAGSEDRVAGYTAFPFDQNPYRLAFDNRIPAAGVVLPKPGAYDIVFDTRSRTQAGPFTFRYWIGDATPPRLTLRSLKGGITVAATDAGSGVDASSIVAALDGKPVTTTYRDGVVTIPAAPGRHRLTLTVADWQETKNMEDVVKILPNTATLTRTVVVRAAQ
jgi:subtilisin family serine protease